MPLKLSEIKQLTTVDLDNFEIRGAKAGLRNARTTGPVYTDGTYVPYKTILTGSGTFSTSDKTVTGLTIDPLSPYTFDSSVLKAGDQLVADATYQIASIINANSLVLDKTPTSGGSKDFTCSLGYRDYLIEPDIPNVTVTTGTASFTPGDNNVYGFGTNWSTAGVVPGDLIKSSVYSKYYQIETVTNSQLTITEVYNGPQVINGAYTIKRKAIGSMKIQYVKNNFTYEKNGGYWKYDQTTGSNIPTSSTSFLPLTDGVTLKFTDSLSDNVSDLVDSALALNKVLATKTANIMPQFPLPAVPNPEENFELYINGQLKDRFPNGNRDYVINYSQNPLYTTPPPIADRKVANLMFLRGVNNVVLPISATYTGMMNFVDQAGNTLSGIMPGSETIVIGDTTQTAHIDYVFDENIGVAIASEHHNNEQVVKYVGVRQTNLVDNGISVTLKGKKQQLSFPYHNTDNVLFTQETGRLKPTNKAHPGPGEEYLVEYLVDSSAVMTQECKVQTGKNYFRTNQYPIREESVILVGNGKVLKSGYRVSGLTGRVVFSDPVSDSTKFQISYTPLSKMVNGVSYSGGKGYCTVYDSRLIILSAVQYTFKLQNQDLDPTAIIVKRIYNETRNKDYDLTGYTVTPSRGLVLSQTAVNVAVGLLDTDIVVIDYTFAQDGVEYAPVSVLGLTLGADSNELNIVGRNTMSVFKKGSIVQLTPSDSNLPYLFNVDSSSFDGEDTTIKFDGSSFTDIVNPDIYVTDSSVSFLPVGYTAQSIENGLSTITFNGPVAGSIRNGTALKVGTDYYSTVMADSSVVTVFGSFPRDYTTASVLSSISYSDVPIYYEGDTNISASTNILNYAAPAMVLSHGYDTYVANSDSSNFVVYDTKGIVSTFNYADKTVSELADWLRSLDMTVGSYASDWTCSKIVPVTNLSIGKDSSSLVSINPALRVNGTDVKNFTVENGLVTLGTGLSKNQDYNLDYLGQQPIGDSSVTISGSQFVYLPKDSRVEASFIYDNLDQFYVQVMGQREFLGTVIEPRVKEEAMQQAGNLGQGGDIPDDADQGNPAGGLVGDEFRRVDQEIECRIDKNIFDYFNDRAMAYGNEMYAATGLRLCNNDGLISEADQSGSTKSFSRMYPDADYTNYEPAFIAPLTGRAIPPYTRVLFINGSPIVNCVSSYFYSTASAQSKWKTQLRAGDKIRRLDSTAYKIASVDSDTQLTLTQPFVGTNSPYPDGDMFEMFSAYAPYDDDGHVGAKLVSTKTGNYGLSGGNVFDLYLDSSYQSYTFVNPSNPFETPPSRYTSQNVADIFNNYFNGLMTTVEWVYDSRSTYGYRESLVLRTRNDTTFNYLRLGMGDAISRLGFVKDSSSCGNIDRTCSNSEVISAVKERALLIEEGSLINTMLAYTNKLDRTATLSAYIKDISSEHTCLHNEQSCFTIEQSSLNHLLDESANVGSLTATRSHAVAMRSLNGTYQPYLTAAKTNIDTMYPSWSYPEKPLFSDATSWSLCRQDGTTTSINGKTVPWGIGVTTPTGTDISIRGQKYFVLQFDPSYDRRMLDTLTLGMGVHFNSPSQTAVGVWTGWDTTVGNRYSKKNDATFTLSNFDLFTIRTDGVPLPGPLSYSIDVSSIKINYGPNPGDSSVFTFAANPTVGALKASINNMAGFDTTGLVSRNTQTTTGLLIGSGLISPDATIRQGLRECTVTFTTISDKNLVDRSSFLLPRIAQIDSRVPNLIARETQIRGDVTTEQLFWTADGSTGDIYNWADNRFNRGNGCEVKLAQTEAMIARNQSALTISKRMLS